MLKEKRRKTIISILNQEGSVTTSDLCERFNTTRQTIHKDLEELQSQGKLKKVYGGAVSTSKFQEAPVGNRKIQNKDEKNRIGQAAASHVSDNDTIFLDASTTVAAMIPYLDQLNNLTVITYSIEIAYQLALLEKFNIHLIGGKVRSKDLACYNQNSFEQLENIFVDRSFFGTGGVSITAGFTDFHFSDSNIRRIMIENSNETFILFDRSKLDTITISKFADLNDIDHLISYNVTQTDFLVYCQQNHIDYLDARTSKF